MTEIIKIVNYKMATERQDDKQLLHAALTFKTDICYMRTTNKVISMYTHTHTYD